jgi:hypothetical protein
MQICSPAATGEGKLLACSGQERSIFVKIGNNGVILLEK